MKLLRVAIYIRVSSEEQASTGDSIRDQQERCAAYINGKSDMTLAETYIDDGISGQKLDRDEFQRLMRDVGDNKVDRIVFTKLDRWFRSLRHYLNTQALLEKHGVSWTAIDQPYFDTSTPYGRAFVAQSMTWAELEAQNGGIRVRDVFRTKIQHGEVITGKLPRGYKTVDKHMVLSDEAPAIYDSIQHFIRTQSLHGTIRYMSDTHGIDMSIYNLKNAYLRNEKLIGRYRGTADYCPRLISDEMYAEIQRILDEKMVVKSSQRYPYIFSGLLVCDSCGYRMSGCSITSRWNRANGERCKIKYPAYVCKQNQLRLHDCDNGGEIRESVIEAYVLDHIEDQLESYIAEYDMATKAGTDNRAKKAKIRLKLDRLKDLYLNEIISLDEYKADRMDIENQLKSIPDMEEPKRDLAPLKKILDGDFKSLYHEFTNEEKRIFWRSVIKEIRIPKSVNRHRDFRIIPL